MRCLNYLSVFVFAANVAVFFVGCDDSSNYVVDETAPDAGTIVYADENSEETAPKSDARRADKSPSDAPKTAANAPRPWKNFDELVASGAKIDATGKSVDFSDVADFGGFADGDRFAAIKVVRGKGPLTADALKTFATLPNLTEFLWIDASLPTSDAEKEFARFAPTAKSLKKIRLTGWKNADGSFPRAAFAALSFAPNLSDVDISGSPATADDFAAVAAVFKSGFPKLTKLNLYQTKIGDFGVETLLPLADRLVSLNLDDAQIGPSSADKIARFARLTFLHVGRSTLDDDSLLKFASLKNLEKFHMTRSEATEAGASALRARLPNCVVVSQPEN